MMRNKQKIHYQRVSFKIESKFFGNEIWFCSKTITTVDFKLNHLLRVKERTPRNVTYS